MRPRDRLERYLSEIPGVTRQPARRGTGFAYVVGDREIAHFHGDHRIDVRLTRAVIAERKVSGGFGARVRTRGPSADWIAVQVSESSDVALALALVMDAVQINA